MIDDEKKPTKLDADVVEDDGDTVIIVRPTVLPADTRGVEVDIGEALEKAGKK